MKPVIIAKGLKAQRAIRDYAARRFDFALNRIQHNIRAATLRISDKDGPKGGIDKRCLVQLSVPGLPDIVVTETAHNVNVAIDRAIHRAAYTAQRLLARAKSFSYTKHHLEFA
ncbi:HPF/RaiA family ribosome-associated protein [Herminiimonas sp. CN]|uniref:HPF/RaiA family ribosome-associated protein n=1 Tax=Herminiimonas sp. CN TaxID=1349818 RepID=UPI0004738557|nr:HPF/RaiA family ribosome-associated protein [Herminiimonas sp. CN]